MPERWGAVICAETAHINIDECGAPEKVGGLKLLTVADAGRQAHPRADRPAGVGLGRRAPRAAAGRLDHADHRARAPSTRPTRSRAICDHAHEHGMKVHMDGARIANAAATLGLPLRAFTTDAGVDVLSFGGTKNGLLLRRGDRGAQPRGVRRRCMYLRKMSMQLASQDALHLGAVRGAARRRPVAAQRLARQRDGAAARGLGARDVPGVRDHAAGAGQRRLRDAADAT